MLRIHVDAEYNTNLEINWEIVLGNEHEGGQMEQIHSTGIIYTNFCCFIPHLSSLVRRSCAPRLPTIADLGFLWGLEPGFAGEEPSSRDTSGFG